MKRGLRSLKFPFSVTETEQMVLAFCASLNFSSQCFKAVTLHSRFIPDQSPALLWPPQKKMCFQMLHNQK